MKRNYDECVTKYSDSFVRVVEYFIVSGKYNIFDINEVLFKYDRPLLGG